MLKSQAKSKIFKGTTKRLQYRPKKCIFHNSAQNPGGNRTIQQYRYSKAPQKAGSTDSVLLPKCRPKCKTPTRSGTPKSRTLTPISQEVYFPKYAQKPWKQIKTEGIQRHYKKAAVPTCFCRRSIDRNVEHYPRCFARKTLAATVIPPWRGGSYICFPAY